MLVNGAGPLTPKMANKLGPLILAGIPDPMTSDSASASDGVSLLLQLLDLEHLSVALFKFTFFLRGN